MERGSSSTYPERTTTGEGLRIFDELASLHMLASDRRHYGVIRPETWQQVYNEELTYPAEGLDAPLATSFSLSYTERGLVDERGTSFMASLDRGRLAAERAFLGDKSQEFNLTRTIHDYEEGRLLESMMRGETSFNTVASWSPLPKEAYERLGSRPLERLGYQPKRLLGFIRVYSKVSASELRVSSVSIDNSNLAAFRMMATRLGIRIPDGELSDNYQAYRFTASMDRHGQDQLPAQLRRYYDEAMAELFGGAFTAGRRRGSEKEAWGFVCEQKDLIQFYFSKLEQLAGQPMEVSQLRRAKRILTYGFWAALKDRYNLAASGTLVSRQYGSPDGMWHAVQAEMSSAYQRAAARHEYLVGCGGGIGLDEDLAEETPENALASIMGDKKVSWVWKPGKCRIDNCPTRPHTTKVGPCDVCRGCQDLFDKGKDPKAEYEEFIRKAPYN